MEHLAKSNYRYSHYSVLHQCVAVASAILVSVSTGMHYGWPSPSLPLLLNNNSTTSTNNSAMSWIVVMPLVGLLPGCAIISTLVDRIGRKPCLLICSPVLFVTWLLIAYASNLIFLVCARFVAGVVDGMVVVTLLAYIGELADNKIRGCLCTVEVIAFRLGILAINVIGIQFDIKKTALIAAAVPALHFFTFVWMPESPYFLALQKGDLVATIPLNDRSPNNGNKETTTLKTKLSKYLDVFTKRIERKSLVVVLGLLLLEHFSGTLAISFYCLTIFNEAGGAISASTSTIVFCSVQMIVGSLSGFLMDKVGRRPMLIVSAVGSTCALIVEGAYFYFKHKTSANLSMFGFVPLTALLMYTACSVGLNIAQRLMVAELFPIKSKAIAMSYANVMLAVFAITASKMFHISKDKYGMHAPFFIFASCCACGLIFVIYCVPETKGKTLEQIQIDLENSSSKQRKHVDTSNKT